MRYLLSLLLLASLSAWAQDRAGLQPEPAIPPPPPGMSSWDDIVEPQVTIKRGDKEIREEFRVAGKLYMVKVTPAGAPPYYLVDNTGDGSFSRADSVTPTTRPPMWVIKEF